MNIGRAIRLCRTERGLKQVELAQKSDISVSYLSMLERGQRDPTLSTLNTIAEALGIPLSILVFLAVDKSEMTGISERLAGDISLTALKLMQTPNVTSALHTSTN